MSKREQIKEIVDSMLDYFDCSSFDELDSEMLGDLVEEIQDCLEIDLPSDIFDDEPSRKLFIDRVLVIYEQG